MPSFADLSRFARSSVFAALFVAGALLLAGAALVGTSMLSVGHLAGAGLASIGLFGLALQQRLDDITWRPSRRFFLVLLGVVTAGYAVQVWAHYWVGAFSLWDVGVFADLLAGLAERGSYWSSPLAVHGFADHFTPTLTLLTPLFMWEPSFLWLIGAKIVAALACAPLLYLIGREVLGKARVGSG